MQMVLESAIGLLADDFLLLVAFQLIFLAVSAVFLWAGAWVAQVSRSSFVRAFAAALVITVISSLLVIPFSDLALFTLFVSAFVNIAVIKFVFAANWRKSVVTWIFSLASHALVFGALALI